MPSISEEVKATHIAAQLGKAGYELAYGGKVHLPGPLQPKNLGFEVLSKDERNGLAESCAAFIKRKHDRPYYLMASFINPHDICYMALRGLTFKNPAFSPGKKLSAEERKLLEAMKIPEGIDTEAFFAQHCPPLPPNYEPQQDEPEAIRWLLRLQNFKMKARKEYTDQDWRLHRWAYCRLTEYVDRQIQMVLDALKESGQEQNTVVILSSDHGDMDASHRMEHKTALYEEAARIPFVVMHKGTAPTGRVDKTHLISNGLDLLPTVCDYAGIQGGAADPRGCSLRPLIEGKTPGAWRSSLGVESQIGRMVVGESCKYIRYDQGKAQEQLLDLRQDPHETRHFTNEESHAAVLKELRDEFTKWFPKV